jgi:hypothetical protein
MMLVTIAGLRFEISEDWCDIAGDLAPGSPPALAREDGVGAIQFSVAKYKSGAKPSITESDLKRMLSELLEAKQVAGVVPEAVAGSRCAAVGAIWTAGAPNRPMRRCPVFCNGLSNTLANKDDFPFVLGTLRERTLQKNRSAY